MSNKSFPAHHELGPCRASHASLSMIAIIVCHGYCPHDVGGDGAQFCPWLDKATGFVQFHVWHRFGSITVCALYSSTDCWWLHASSHCLASQNETGLYKAIQGSGQSFQLKLLL